MLRLVRGTYENRHGYRCPQRIALSSAPEHDVAFLMMGFPSAQNPHVLEVVEVPQELQVTGRVGLTLARLSLAGANEMHFTATEQLEIIRQELGR